MTTLSLSTKQSETAGPNQPIYFLPKKINPFTCSWIAQLSSNRKFNHFFSRQENSILVTEPLPFTFFFFLEQHFPSTSFSRKIQSSTTAPNSNPIQLFYTWLFQTQTRKGFVWKFNKKKLIEQKACAVSAFGRSEITKPLRVIIPLDDRGREYLVS